MSERTLKRIDEWVDRHGIKSSELCMLLDNLQKYKEEMEQRLKEADFIVKKISDYCLAKIAKAYLEKWK